MAKNPYRNAQEQGLNVLYPTDTPGRWFGPGWNWRIFPPGDDGELPGKRVLAWKVDRWYCVDKSELEDGDVWLPLPGAPVSVEKTARSATHG